MSTPLGNSVPQSGIPYIDAIIQGSKWSSNNITYSFWSSADDSFNYFWLESEKDIVRAALSDFSRVVNISFTEVANNGVLENNSSDMSFYFFDGGAGIEGIAMFPDPNHANNFLAGLGGTRADYPTIEGDVTYNPNSLTNNFFTYYGGRGWVTVLHEIGHALGLKHTHDDGGNGRPTISQVGLGGNDNQVFTVMSYNSAPNSSLSLHNAATLMPYDIAALQYIYGANMNTQAGNDIYSLTDDGIVVTLWDAAGSDTLDGTSLLTNLNINLQPGTISQIGNTYGAIAFGTVVENIFSGAGNDTLYGNDIDNIMRGNSGNDSITAFGGNDQMFGGDGNDWLQGNLGNDHLEGGVGNDEMYGGKGSDFVQGNQGNDFLNGNNENDTVFGGQGNDVVRGGKEDDFINGNNEDDQVFGDLGNDILRGGKNNDFISGGDGNDSLFGDLGNDLLQGDTGADNYIFNDNSGFDSINGFEDGADKIYIQININNSGFVSFAGINITDSSGSAEIDFGNANILNITGIPAGQLAADDFVFF